MWSLLRFCQRELNDVRGGYRLGKLIEPLCPPLFPVRIDGLADLWIDPRVESWQTRELFFAASYPGLPHEPHLQRIARALIRPTDVVVDVGANLGLLTLLFDQLAQRVHAVEPNPILLPGLRETIRHLRHTTLHECAIGEVEGTATLHVPEDHSQASLAAEGGRAFQCPVRRLNSIVDRADFLKIDVEGAELLVLRGAASLIDREDAPVIVFEEVHKTAEAFGQVVSAAHDYLASLTRPGYTFHTLHREGHITRYGHDRPVWSDVLAVPAVRRAEVEAALGL